MKMKKTIVSLLCFISFVFMFSAFSATTASAEEVRVKLKVVVVMDSVQIPAPFVVIQDAKTDEFLGETDGFGVALVTCDRKATLTFSSMETVAKKVKLNLKKKDKKEVVVVVEYINYDELENKED